MEFFCESLSKFFYLIELEDLTICTLYGVNHESLDGICGHPELSQECKDFVTDYFGDNKEKRLCAILIDCGSERCIIEMDIKSLHPSSARIVTEMHFYTEDGWNTLELPLEQRYPDQPLVGAINQYLIFNSIGAKYMHCSFSDTVQ